MRTYAFTCLYLLVLCTASFGVQNPNSSGVPGFIGYVDDEFVVVLKEEASEIARGGGTPGNALGHIASLEGLRSKFKVDRVKRQFPQRAGNAVLSAAQGRLSRHYKVRFRGGDLDAVMNAYAKHPLVEHVEPIGVHAISIVPPNDKYYDDPPPTFPYDQWHYWDTYGIDAEAAWDQTAGDPEVVVAVLDTGVKYYHSDLGGPGGLWDPASPSTAGNIWINEGEIPGNSIDDDGNGYIDDTVGYDFISDASATFTLCVDADCATADNDPDDGQGHGTHVAGTVGAITNNSISVAGIAGGYSDGTAEGTGNGTKVMCLRIGWRAQYLLTGELIGIVRMDYAAEAMNYVATMVEAGTNVVAVNCSWGSSNSGGIDAAVDNLLAHGVMVIHAAGNGNANDPGYLGGKDGVMNVGATQRDGYSADFSNYGLWVDVAGPGVDVVSTYHNPDNPDPLSMYVAAMSGTSMSAPHACGVAALLEAKANMLGVDLDGAAKFQIMVDTTSIPYFGNKYVGSGILNAKNALDAVGPPCEVVADFSADATTGCSSLGVVFSDLSSGGVTSWDWDFGDGGTSTAQDPSHTYNAPGVYTVTLVASSDTCSDAEVKTDYISVGSVPVAAFSADPTAGYAPLTVSFTDESAGNPTSWSWDFGDGGSSTTQSPSHTYEASGTYTVRLTAQNACGADIAESIGLITVEEPPSSTDALALADIPVKGVVTGDYRNTHAFDLDYEFLTEVLSGGRPSRRYSVLDHRWEFNIAGGDTITFSAAAFSTEGLDGDDFQFEYSTDDSNYEYLMAVSKTDISIRTTPLPNYLSGRVYIRVVDTGHSPGTQTLDSVFVDYLSIASEGTAPPPSGSMYVQSTSVVRIPGRGGRYQAEAEAVVVDGNGTPLSGATVEGSFSGPTSENVSGVTGADGSVSFRSKKVKNPSDNWCFGVTQVTYPGLSYDPGMGVPSACE